SRNSVHPDHPFEEDHGIGAVDVWRNHAGTRRIEAGLGEISAVDFTSGDPAIETATGRITALQPRRRITSKSRISTVTSRLKLDPSCCGVKYSKYSSCFLK